MQRVHLDFETRSEVDVKEVGGAVYAAHPSTEILCLAWKVDDGLCLQYQRHHIAEWDVSGPYEDCWLRPLAADPNVLFVAHNAFFEQMVWRYIMVRRYGYPEIPIVRWRCTAAKAATYALPRSLEGVANALNLPVRKNMEGSRVMKKLAKPRARLSAKNQDKYWEPDKLPGDFKTLYEYNGVDVETEYLVDCALPDLRPLEQEIWFMDQRLNHHGVKLDLPAVGRALEFLEIATEKLTQEFNQVTQGMVERPSQRARFMQWMQNVHGVCLPDLKAATVDKILSQHKEQKHLPEAVASALIIKAGLGRTSTAKYLAMQKRVSADGRLRDILLYYGASRTGRWAGRGVQPQNFVRPSKNLVMETAVRDLLTYDYEFFEFLYGSVMDVLAEMIRGMLVADEGHELFVADFAAVEARVNAWVSGEQTLLDLFTNGECNYCQLASSIYDKPINKTDHPDERQIGKVGELAMGYEGGINAFATMAVTYRLDLTSAYPHIWASATSEERDLAIAAYNKYRIRSKEPVSREFALCADIIKQRYRIARPEIKRNWRLTEEAAIQAVLTGKPVQASKCVFFTHGERVRDVEIMKASPGPTQPYQVDGVSYVRTSKNACYKWDTYFLHIKLPSGRCLAYHQPELYLAETPWRSTWYQLAYKGVDEQNRYHPIETYGGKLVENIVQAISRDLMAESFLRIEKAGYTPLLQVHDEAVSQRRKGEGSLAEYEQLMAQTPSWAQGLPIKAEAWSGFRYKKG